MARWNRDRSRQRGRQSAAGAAGEQQALTPEQSAGNSVFEPSTDEVDPGESSPNQEATANAPQKSRSRRGRRKKRTSSAQERPVAVAPLIPAYSASEGPRAPSPVSVTPGAPTGEAAELEEPEPAAAPARPTAAPAPAKRASKGAVVLSVGLPGSGKTTWFKRKGVTPLSSDLLRTLLFDDPTEQRHQDLVFSSLRSLLRARMIARMSANYVDATNLSPKERRHWIRMAREFGYDAHAVYFDVPLETCLERNRKRQRVVPEDVMQRMAAKLRPPTFEEGFSKIVVVRVKHRAADESEQPEPAETDVAAELNPDEPEQ